MTPEVLSALKTFFGGGPASPFLVILALAVVHQWRAREKDRAKWDAERSALLAGHQAALSASQEARVVQAERITHAATLLAQGVAALQMLSTQKQPRHASKLELSK